jgi:hypothetical protein
LKVKRDNLNFLDISRIMSSGEEEIPNKVPSVKKEHSYTYWVDKEKQ